jgi:hypothetical protein
MANLYGPMAYRPNPGITLNSSPMQQFQAPAPVAPVAPVAAPSPMSYRDWRSQNPIKWGYGGGRGDSSTNDRNNTARRHREQYMMEMLGNGRGGVPGMQPAAPAATPGITLDSVAQAYAKFLNGGQ